MPSGRVGAAFVGPYDIHTLTREHRAQAQFGQAMQHIAGQIATIAIKRQAARDETAAADAMKKVADYDYAALTDLETRTFEETSQFERAESEYLKSRGQIISQATKGLRPAPAERFRNYGKQSQAQARLRYHNKLFPKEQQFHQASFLAKFDDYKRRGEKAKAELLIEQYRPWFTPTQTETFGQTLDHDIEYSAGVHLAENNPAWLLEVADEEGFFEHLNTEEIERLKDRAESELSKLQIQANRQQVGIQNQMRKEATDRLIDDTLTVGWLRDNKQNMADDDYERFNKYLMERKVEALEEKETEETLRRRWELISEITDLTDDIRRGEGDPVEVKRRLDELATLGTQGVSDAEQYRMKLSAATEYRYSTHIGQAMKDAKEYGRGQIIEQGPLALGGTAIVRRRYAEYAKALEDWLTEQEAAKKPVTVDDVYNESRRLAAMYRLSRKAYKRLEKKEKAELEARGDIINVVTGKVKRKFPKPTEKEYLSKYGTTKDDLLQRAQKTDDDAELRTIYEQGKRLGYWE